MNKTNLKRYAPQARKDFIAAVTARANVLGLSEGAGGRIQLEPAQVQGDVAVIGGRAWPARVTALPDGANARSQRPRPDRTATGRVRRPSLIGLVDPTQATPGHVIRVCGPQVRRPPVPRTTASARLPRRDPQSRAGTRPPEYRAPEAWTPAPAATTASRVIRCALGSVP